MDSIYYANTSPGSNSLNFLSIQEVGIHHRLGIDKPSIYMNKSVFHILFTDKKTHDSIIQSQARYTKKEVTL